MPGPVQFRACGSSDRRWRRLVDSNVIGVIIAQVDGRITEANDAFLQMVGYSREDLIAGEVRWDRMTPPEFRPLDEQALSSLAQTGRCPPWEKEYIRKDGSRVPVLVCVTSDDSPDTCMGLVLDRTDRKRAEEHFHQLLESAPDAMVIADHEGRIVAVNAETERVFGYGRHELLGQPIELLVPDRFRGKHLAQRADYAVHPHQRPMGIGMEVVGRRKDGSEFPAEVSLRPIQTDEGLLVSSAIRDISQRKRAEHTLRETEVQMLAAQRIQEHLLPAESPRLPGFDVAGAMHPAELTAGDYFDFVPMCPPCIAIVIGDVSGHGFGPALLMAATHAYLHSLAQMHDDPGEILARANAILVEHSDEERFVTLLLTKLDPVERSLVYAGAGHPPGYVLAADGRVKARLESVSLPLGVSAETRFETSPVVRLEPGDLVALLTDGLLEARSPDGRPFGPQGVLDVIGRNRDRSSREIIEALYRGVAEFTGLANPADDATAVVIKVLA